MNQILVPPGLQSHTRQKFYPKNQMIGTTKLAKMAQIKSSIGDLGVTNHRNREPIGVAPIFESAINHPNSPISLPYPGNKSKLFTLQVMNSIHNTDDASNRFIKIATGAAANDETHLALSRTVHRLKLGGLTDNLLIREIKYSVALTDTKAEIILFVNGRDPSERNKGYDSFHVFYCLSFNIADNEFLNEFGTINPVHALGIQGKPLVNRYLSHAYYGPSFSPLWDKDNEAWIYLTHDPSYAQIGSVVSTAINGLNTETHLTGNLNNLRACVTLDRRAFCKEGGLSSNGMGVKVYYPPNLLDTPGGVGGLGTLSRSGWSTITVVSDEYNYFISLDENDDVVIDGVSHELHFGACDYDEEIDFRNMMADLHGL